MDSEGVEMNTGKILYKCWFCETDISLVLVEDLVVSYEESKTDGGKTYKETYATNCLKCKTPTMITFKQFRAGGLVQLDKKKGRH